jgi:excinuclease ABC subunit A
MATSPTKKLRQFERSDSIAAPAAREAGIASPKGDVSWLWVRGATHNNLKDLDVRFPLGRFTCVTGVSGSGKSSLVNDILYEALARELNGALTEPGKFQCIEVLNSHGAAKPRSREGEEKERALKRAAGKRTCVASSLCGSVAAHLDKIIAIDQTPIGRTPRSNPATYIKLFDEIRDLYTKLPDAKLRGYKPGRFSFNVASGRKGGGRCEACEGNGSNKIEMDFLADVWVTCPVCEGKRFMRDTLQIQFKGRSIAEVLDMDVQQAIEHFDNQPRVRNMLQTLHDVGLDYIKIGQPSPTLSGGEAQRIKLARELVKRGTGRTLYVLDEPTTGLHFEDIRKLLAVLHSFVDAGNTVIVIEHNLDVIKTADWIIDLGPEGGEGGGWIICEGTPEQVADTDTDTGRVLRAALAQRGAETLNAERTALKEVAAGARRAPTESSAFSVQTSDFIHVRGAAQHNLKSIDVSFPRDQMTVCTGVSGSGKTSFAIDTVYTEGHRRYVESLSAYARQFLGQLQKPKVEHIEGLSPAICIEQKAASKSPRSTVGTITEIYDYLRVLWARAGTRFCSTCDVPIGTQTIDEIVERVMALEQSTPIIILAPVALGDGESWTSVFNRLKASGYTRVRIDGAVQETAHALTIDARRKHRVEVVVDRTIVRTKSRSRIAEAVEHALMLGNGVMTLVVEDSHFAAEERHEGTEARTHEGERAGNEEPAAATAGKSADVSGEALQSKIQDPKSKIESSGPQEMLFSQKLACSKCGTSYEELSPHHYSFNSQMGWCETCEGLGVQRGAPAASIIKHPNKSLFSGAIAGWGSIDSRSPFGRVLLALCTRLGVEPRTALNDWTHEQKQALLYGTSGEWIDGDRYEAAKARRHQEDSGGPSFRFHWRGFFPAIDNATRNSWSLRYKLHNVVTDIPCIACRGGRLRSDSAATKLVAKNAERGTRNDEQQNQASAFGAVPSSPTLVELCQWPLQRVADYFTSLDLDKEKRAIAGELLQEIRSRLQFLIDVGLEYLTLHRAAPTLSGGEAQRIRLASQIGSGLSGVLYVLDEPTIGLHPRDTKRLIAALAKLQALGNTLLLVEHDREVIASADRILDFGPRAGRYGGEIVAEGTPQEVRRAERGERGAGVSETEDRAESRSLTRGYLSGDVAIPIPSNRRTVAVSEALALQRGEVLPAVPSKTQSSKSKMRPARIAPAAADREGSAWLLIRGARQNNLTNVNVPLPLGRFVCVTGVSGSGKSSLINDILWPVLANKLMMANQTPGEHDGVEFVRHEGTQARRHEGDGEGAKDVTEPISSPSVPLCLRASVPLLDKVINVDQSPLGATPSSNPATYTGVFDLVRELFARLPDSKLRGYNANRFSFNRPGGRCEACEGYGQKRIEMHFMSDVWVECETCRGKRYEPETLNVRFKDKSIADVLDMRVAEALELFDSVPKIRRLLQMLSDVGLGYVQLGQPAPTLSGGEAQRVKLAGELGKPDTGRTLYILDEPTTGLHFDDVRRLLDVLQRLVDLGNTVLCVEHNLDVLKSADWIIDLGPEAGAGGGQIVAMGTPEGITQNDERRTLNAEENGRCAESPQGPKLQHSAFSVQTSHVPSHTAAALRPVLAAGPYSERPVYDRLAHAARELAIEKAGLGRIGKEIKQPWQVDGRKWHLSQRTSRDGKPTRWQPAALEFVIDLVQDTGAFAPTNWNDRASIEVIAAGAETWFLHALTGGEWLLELYFRAPPDTFDAGALNRKLGLKTLDEREDIQAYGSWPRVDLRKRMDGLDAIAVYVHDKIEIDTPAFRQFVKQAVAAYAKSQKK